LRPRPQRGFGWPPLTELIHRLLKLNLR
jgi:hypothetical protein